MEVGHLLPLVLSDSTMETSEVGTATFDPGCLLWEAGMSLGCAQATGTQREGATVPFTSRSEWTPMDLPEGGSPWALRTGFFHVA